MCTHTHTEYPLYIYIYKSKDSIDTRPVRWGCRIH